MFHCKESTKIKQFLLNFVLYPYILLNKYNWFSFLGQLKESVEEVQNWREEKLITVDQNEM